MRKMIFFDIDGTILHVPGGQPNPSKELKEAGIELFGGVVGEADSAVVAYLKRELTYNPEIKCNHHDHDHDCGSHCGGNCGGHE